MMMNMLLTATLHILLTINWLDFYFVRLELV